MWEKDDVIWRVRWTWSETSCRQHYAEGMVPRTAEESSWSAFQQWITSIYPNYTELSFKELFSQFKWINLYSGSRHSCVNLGRISQLSEDLITLVKWTQSHSYFDHTLPQPFTHFAINKREKKLFIWKDVPHHMLSDKCKLKQQDCAIYLSEWPKSRTLTTPNADEDVEQQELSFIAGGNAKWYSHSGQFDSFLQN